jgi:hypothetical protein
MDEQSLYLERIIFRCGLGFGIFLLILIVGFVSGKFRSSKKDESTGVKDYNLSREPMSPDETIGEISMRLGEDVRDVWGKGYSDGQINGCAYWKIYLGRFVSDEAGRK